MNVSDLRRMIAAELAEVHTCLPGVIVSYDGEFAVVRPTLAKQLANGDTLPAPKIVRVPVCWPVGDVGGAKALITVPLKPGDPVEIRFCERALDDWLSGLDGAPGDPRQFDLSDAFATPLHRPGLGLAADLQNVSLQYGPGSIKISPEGKITFVAPAGVLLDTPLVQTTGNIQAGDGGSGSVAIQGSVTADDFVSTSGISLTGHKHPTAPTGPVSPPIP